MCVCKGRFRYRGNPPNALSIVLYAAMCEGGSMGWFNGSGVGWFECSSTKISYRGPPYKLVLLMNDPPPWRLVLGTYFPIGKISIYCEFESDNSDYPYCKI